MYARVKTITCNVLLQLSVLLLYTDLIYYLSSQWSAEPFFPTGAYILRIHTTKFKNKSSHKSTQTMQIQETNYNHFKTWSVEIDER